MQRPCGTTAIIARDFRDGGILDHCPQPSMHYGAQPNRICDTEDIRCGSAMSAVMRPRASRGIAKPTLKFSYDERIALPKRASASRAACSGCSKTIRKPHAIWAAKRKQERWMSAG